MSLKKVFKNRQTKNMEKYVFALDKTGTSLSRIIKEIQSKHNKIDENFFEELEEQLVLSDISSHFVVQLINEIKKEVKIENIVDPKLISEIIADKIFAIYTQNQIVDTSLNIQNDRTNVIIMVGVNGVGKTTSLAKIANRFINENKKVLIVAADTFRAGAVEQLKIWAQRIGSEIISSNVSSADPASVVYQAMQKNKVEKYDLIIIDTAGRLQNKVNLMQELLKINKIIEKEIPGAPHESLLVLDATTGQNALLQAQAFKEVTPLSGIVLTKMDGTSKGGIVLTIKEVVNLPVKLIGLGEGIDDLQEFDLEAFIFGLTKNLEGDN